MIDGEFKMRELPDEIPMPLTIGTKVTGNSHPREGFNPKECSG